MNDSTLSGSRSMTGSRMVSIRAISSGSNVTSAAVALSTSCSGFEAPTMAATLLFCRTQANQIVLAYDSSADSE